MKCFARMMSRTRLVVGAPTLWRTVKPVSPKCGQRVAIPHRDSFDKENRARYRAISKGEPVVCVHCGEKIETK